MVLAASSRSVHRFMSMLLHQAFHLIRSSKELERQLDGLGVDLVAGSRSHGAPSGHHVVGPTGL